ncbi:hypothetical protein MMC10_002859 [Thelotrema lepadinum]|nr:hypothetical protein [Thelotrema lepadinum]
MRIPSGPVGDPLTIGIPSYIQRIAQKVASFEQDPQAKWDLRKAACTKLCELLVDHNGRRNAMYYFYNGYCGRFTLDFTRDVIVAAIALERSDIVDACIGRWKKNGFWNGIFPSPIAVAAADASRTKLFNRLLTREHKFEITVRCRDCHELASAWVYTLANDMSECNTDLFDYYLDHGLQCPSSRAALTKSMRRVMRRGSGDFKLLGESLAEQEEEDGLTCASAMFLHAACHMGQTRALDAALKGRYIDINQPLLCDDVGCIDGCLCGLPPLFTATSRGQADLVRFLLSNGASTRYPGHGHVLEKAAMGGYILPTQLLFDLSRPTILEADFLVALKAAAVRGHEAFVQCVLELYGVSDVERWKQEVRTWLPHVRDNGYEGVARLLERWGF